MTGGSFAPYGPVLTSALTDAGLSDGVIGRLAEHGVTGDLLKGLLATPGLRSSDDASGLLLLVRSGLSEDEVLDWARVGSLESGARLFSTGIPIEQVRTFPLHGEPLANLVRLHQEAHAHGISHDTMLWWVAGQVLSVKPPYVDEAAYAKWRSTGVHHMGMPRAALACAAGLSPTEAVNMFTRGEFDDDALRALAGLRLSQG